MNRFACPGCKRVLAGRDEHAGKIVICPKCGQRMLAPRQQRAVRERTNRLGWRRMLIAGIVLVGLLLLAGAGGIWTWTHFQNRDAEPGLAAPQTPVAVESESKEAVAARLQRAEEKTKSAERHVENMPPQPRRAGEGKAPAERHVENVPPQPPQTTKQPQDKPPVQEPPLAPASIPPLPGGGNGGAGAIVYPAPGQMRLPLWFPGNETPDPLPQTKEKRAGYPVTLTFPPQTRIEDAAAHLSNKQEGDVAIWLSSPEKPANPQFPQAQRSTICLIAKKPLQPGTRYHVEVSAKINGAAWSAKWDFATISESEIHDELAGAFLRLLNKLRRSAGLPPLSLDPERSKPCAAHARYLVRNAADNPALNWNDEKAELPGYTAEAAAVARTAAIQGGGGPVEAVAGLIDSLLSRQQLLDPRLHHLGLGYTPFALGGWIWVIDLQRGAQRGGSISDGGDTGREYFYPAPDQENVPLIYPPNEVPSPIPKERDAERGNEGLVGYAITVLFGPGARITTATAKLADDKGAEVDGWLSTPEKPAIAGFPQRSLCFLPKAPLRPDTRYTATFQAEVNGKAWRRMWSFITLKEPDRYSDDLEKTILARVNAVRQAAGLRAVRLDAELSQGCQSHARYLARNHRRPEVRGMGMHRQNADLPGASPQGARAAKESVIAVVLDPQTCIENWMATLYHRLPILTPNLERIGFGHARIQGHEWVCVLDTGNGRAPQN